MLDSDLAALYGVETKRLNEQVKRNTRRFPADFAFRLSSREAESLRSQTATLKHMAPKLIQRSDAEVRKGNYEKARKGQNYS
ncbi:MAG: ORF6N domain-containing protein, partial [Elusimicrobia bacterium]|nr:ORF6N domain-containing protein [Elusimicrobiota bacterium]